MSSITTDKRVLVVAEIEGGEIASVTFELLSAGKKLAAKTQSCLCVAVLGSELEQAATELTSFADEVYLLDHPLLKDARAELIVDAMEQLCGELTPHTVLMGQTLSGINMAPRLAYRLGVPLITDAIGFDMTSETGSLLCDKPVFGAKAMSTFKLAKKPYMATLRANVQEPITMPGEGGKVIRFEAALRPPEKTATLVEKVKEEIIHLKKADAIVSGGRGVKDGHGIDQLNGLMGVLGNFFDRVEMGASRPLVDAQLVPSSRQIGLTGEKVSPELYIAVGISGSLQHVTGISGSKKVLAINNNPKAPIFEFADYGIIGGFEDVVPAFIKELEDLT